MSERRAVHDDAVGAGRDWLGVAIFCVGAFFSVLAAMYAFDRRDNATGTAWIAERAIGLLGALPTLALGIGVAALGARMFLGRPERTGRYMLGVLGGAVGLAVLAGALTERAGGALGARVGGTLADLLTPVGGALVALLFLLAPIWFAWVRERVLSAQVRSRAQHERPATAARPGFDGISADEAAALVPQAPRVAERAQQAFSAPPPSPYAEDVRRKGEIPPGARPLEATHATRTSAGAPELHEPQRWTPESALRADDAAGADLAAADRVEPEARRDLGAQAATAAAAALSARVEEAPPAERATSARPLADVHGALAQPLETPAAPPRPSWEQSDLFEAPEEPVDAYGTPLSLVEALRADRAAMVSESAKGAVEEPLPTEADEGDDLFDAPEALDEDEIEAEDEGWDEAAELDEEDESDDEEELEADEAELEEDELEEAAELDEEQAEELEDALAVEPIAESEAERAPAPALDDAAPLFAASAAAAEPTRAAEPEYVLQPQPQPPPAPEPPPRKRASARKEPEAPPELPEIDELVYKAGLLFLDRGRVAVSLLQREFGLDFDRSCAVLDELQSLGLIGPFLGGQRRDILLTKDQWQQRVTSR